MHKCNSRLVGKIRQFVATVCLGAVSFGSSLAWTSPVLPKLQQPDSLNLTIEEGSWIGAMMAIGALCSAVPAGFLADRFGPKKCIVGFVVPVLVFAVLVVFANDVYLLCVARVFSGIAAGGVCVVSPMYISETADVSLRGILSSFFELLIYVGVVQTAICGAYLSYITLTIILGAFALACGVIFAFLPESPTYLVKTNRREKAEKALRFYRSNNYNVAQDIDEISEGLSRRSEHKINPMKALKSKAARRALIASIGLRVCQQSTAIDGINFYTVQIFQAAGTNLDAYTSAIIIALVQLFSAAFLVFIIEKANRKTFMYISATGIGISLAFLGFYFHMKEESVRFPGMDVLPVTSLVIFTLSFALGLGPVPWMINGELFSPEIKGLCNGISFAVDWTLLFIVTKSLPIMMVDIGPHYTFYFFSACMVMCIVFTKFCIPETRGKTLEQIQIELSS